MGRDVTISRSAENVRAPRQGRSQKRVDQILEAARSIIAQKGSAGLTISEIAGVADVTAGSMYQYFPGKAAVIHALAERSLEKLEAIFGALLEREPRSREAFAAMLADLLEDYHQFFCDDPVIRDIWAGVGSDKSLADLNQSASERLVQQLLPIVAALYPNRDLKSLSINLRLSLSFGDAATETALYADAETSRALIDQAKRFLMHFWLDVL